jgi:hypothetical protein
MRLRPPPSRRIAPRLTRRALLTALLAVSGTVAATSCRHGARAPAENDAVPIPEFVLVSVDNHNWSDVVVSLVRGGAQPFRLGTVTAGQSTVLRFPGQYIAGSTPLELLAKPIGGFSTLRSPRFVVQPGQSVTWTLENALERSSLAVF